jgi:hypothetical protein
MGMPFAAYVFPKESGILKNTGTEKSCLMISRAKMSLTSDQVYFANQKYGDNADILSGWADEFIQKNGYRFESLDYSGRIQK